MQQSGLILTIEQICGHLPACAWSVINNPLKQIKCPNLLNPSNAFRFHRPIIPLISTPSYPWRCTLDFMARLLQLGAFSFFPDTLLRTDVRLYWRLLRHAPLAQIEHRIEAIVPARMAPPNHPIDLLLLLACPFSWQLQRIRAVTVARRCCAFLTRHLGMLCTLEKYEESALEGY